MGGSSKKQTVGYKYYLGIHMILCHGPVDYLKRIEVDKKTLIEGAFPDSQLNVNRPDLFGGEKREGGVSGAIDFENGLPTQSRNDYLQARLGANIPAFRGVVGVVLRQVYLGVNPYLKRWAFRLQRIHVRQDNVSQWYDEKAEIFGFTSSSNAYFEDWSNGLSGYSIVDTTGGASNPGTLGDFSIESDTYGNCLLIKNGAPPYPTHPSIAKSLGVSAPLQYASAKFKLVTLDSNDCGFLELRDADLNVVAGFNVARDSSVDSLRRPTFGFVDQPGNPGNPIGSGPVTIGEWYSVVMTYNPALSQFTCSITHIDSDTLFGSATVGVSSRSDISYVIYGNDGSGDSGTSKFDDITIITSQVTGDMNPAHIIRECLTDPDWGMGYQEADIDDVSFAAAADTLFAEGMGISLLWDRQNTIEAFVQEIVKHIDASLYVDRTTGKFVLKLVRGDYDENALIEFDEANVAQIQNLKRAAFGELVNSVTVNYWDSQTGETSSLTVQDTALAQMQATVINTTVQYPGFTNYDIAARVAARDLKALSSPLWSCTIYADKDADALNIGDVFKLSWSDYGLNSVVMRVTGMSFGDGKSNRVKIIAVQDSFALPDTAVLATPDPGDGWQPIDTDAQPVVQRVVTEAPYYEIVTLIGQVQADDDLAANADLGYVFAAGGRPSVESALNALLYVDNGSGTYEESGPMDFSPYAFLDEDVTAGQLTFAITGGVDLDIVEIGTHAQIGNELVRVDSISDTSITVGRGLLDTVPPPLHSTGSQIVFWDNYPASDEVQYSASETINVKLLTTTGAGTLDEGSASADSVTLNSRAIRPYPPGNVLINSLAFPEYMALADDLSLTWSHRDRTQQTSGDFYDYLDASIGPEVGTTYSINIYNEDGDLVKQLTGETGTSYLWATEIDDSSIAVDTPNSDQYWNNVVFASHFNGTNGSTTFVDSSNNGLTITPVDNAQISTVNSVFGGASIKFDGSGDYAYVNDTNELELSNEDFTIDLFVNFSGYPDINGSNRYAAVLNKYALNNKSWILSIGSPNTTAQLSEILFAFSTTGSDDVNVTVPVSLSLNTWYHIEVVRSGNTLYIFLDGVLQNAGGSSFNYTAYNGSAQMRIGGLNYSGGTYTRWFNGYVDDLRITKGVARHTSNFTPPTSEFAETAAFRKNGKITYEAWSIRDGYESLYKQTHTVLRYGYGFNYGLYYGGV